MHRSSSNHQNDIWKGSSLGKDCCLTLKQVVSSFSAPITEEHAWAVVYEMVKTLDLCLSNPSIFARLFSATSLDHVLLHQDGHIHETTYLQEPDSVFSHDRIPIVSENKALSGIGLVIFTALDFGLGEDQERALSIDLETLLDLLASEDSSRDEDEGIENDVEKNLITRSELCKRVLQVCARHLAVEAEAQTHYKAVCCALVSESLELSKFMEKVKRHETESDCKELQELGLQDWARLWRQILTDIRSGVKLKKVNFTKTPVEYELAPYEMLMSDIQKGPRLNKIMVDGELPPRLKKDAHDIILQFIKARPPLKPALERRLQPARKESTPAEMLFEDIRDCGGISSLRQTGGPRPRPQVMRLNSNSSMERSRTRILDDENFDETDLKSLDTNRRKVTLDPGLLDDLLNFSDEEESDPEDTELSRRGSMDSIISQESINRQNNNKKQQPEATQQETGSPSKWKKGHQRRHSLTVCETPVRTNPNPTNQKQPIKPHKPPLFETQFSNISSNLSSGSATPTSEPGTPTCDEEQIDEQTDPVLAETSIEQMQARLHAEFLQSDHWTTALQTLDLNLDEIVHIRSVLTKAELEGLPLDGNLKEDVEKGKVCFLCMKTRFGFFNRGCKCELCTRQVCSKCTTKMRIPLEHLASTVPIFSLSSSQVPVEDQLAPKSIKDRFFGSGVTRSGERRVSIGSAPTSPAFQRKMAMSMLVESHDELRPGNLTANQMLSSSLTSFDHTAIDNEYGDDTINEDISISEKDEAGPPSLPFVRRTSYFQRFSQTRLSNREQTRSNKSKSVCLKPATPTGVSGAISPMADSNQGPERTLCQDCKEMILQVVRAQSTARRLQFAKSLFQQTPTI